MQTVAGTLWSQKPAVLCHLASGQVLLCLDACNTKCWQLTRNGHVSGNQCACREATGPVLLICATLSQTMSLQGIALAG